MGTGPDGGGTTYRQKAAIRVPSFELLWLRAKTPSGRPARRSNLHGLPARAGRLQGGVRDAFGVEDIGRSDGRGAATQTHRGREKLPPSCVLRVSAY